MTANEILYRNENGYKKMQEDFNVKQQKLIEELMNPLIDTCLKIIKEKGIKV